MFTRSWANTPFARTPRSSRKSASRRRHAARPSQEQLEDRLVLANFTLSSLADDNSVGTLRNAITEANLLVDIGLAKSNTITIPSSLYSYDLLDPATIELTGTLPAITSQITITGENPPPDALSSTPFAISGQGQTQIFQVAAGGSLTLNNLNIENGFSPSFGGAINNSGVLDLEGVTVENSTAANGGAIASSGGSLTVNNSTIADNSASVAGGGVWISGGSATFNSAIITYNTVTGIDNSMVSPASNPIDNSGGSAEGGGLFISGSVVTITSTTISANVAQGGQGGAGGDGAAGASYYEQAAEETNGISGGSGEAGADGGSGGQAAGGGIAFDSGALIIVSSTLANNVARGGTGGPGGAGGMGGAGQPGGDVARLNDVDLTSAGNGGLGGAGGQGGNGGAGGNALGGGLYVGIDFSTTDVELTNSTVANNQAIGGQGTRSGNGGDGGAGGTGGFGPIESSGGSLSGVGGTGGNGGNGGTTGVPGHGQGGGVDFADSSTEGFIISSTVAFNVVARGPDATPVQVPDPKHPGEGRYITLPAQGTGGKGGTAGASGAGQTITNPDGANGTEGAFGVSQTTAGGGIGYSGTDATYFVVLENSIVAANTLDSTSASDIAGTFTVPGNSLSDLIGTGGAGGLVNGQAGNQVGVGSPGLLPLGNYGGPTQTIALMDSSPAVDAGNTAFAQANGLTTDQRGTGFPRIVGGAVDIGAYESEASLVVTTLVDEDNGTADPTFGAGTSLREAINFADTKSTPQTITFAPGLTGTINLTGPLQGLAKNLAIQGPGADSLTVRRDTGGEYPIFQVASGASVILSGLTVANGSGSIGGGIINEGSLIITSSTVSGNNAIVGAGIENDGTLTVVNSTLSDNTAIGQGGGIYNNGSVVTVINSTFSGNSGGSDGGGIYNEYGRRLTVINSTFSGNSADGGGGIQNFFTLTLNNSIVANSPEGGDVSNRGTVTGSNNLIQSGSGLDGLTGTLTDDPLLGKLQDNGGPTPTMALLPGSPALDAGNDSYALDPTGNPLSIDQRGLARISGAAVDIGAYEVQQIDVDPATLPDGPWGMPYNSQTFTATQDGYQPSWGPITFAVTAGTLPTGLNLSTDGVLSGTPMPSQAGTFKFTVTAGDIAGFGSQKYTVTINPPPPISLSNATLASGTRGIPYSQTFTATQDGYQPSWGPFTFAVTDGTLPDGLNLSTGGVLSGSPTAVGTFSFTVTASNLSGSDSDAYTVTIAPTPQPVVDTLADNFDGDSSAGQLSLREAIAIVQLAGVDSPVTFAPGLHGTIDLTLGEIAIIGNVDIKGPGAGTLTIDANGAAQIFDVNDGDVFTYSNFSVSGLTLTGASDAAIWSSEQLTLTDVVVNGDAGSGVVNYAGDLRVVDSTISNNGASGIVNMGVGPATVTGSTISDNSTTGNGGGISNLESGQLTLINTTISGNSATNGGGIFSEGFVGYSVLPSDPYPSAQMTLENVTVAGNSAILGAGVFNHWSSALTLDNTIIADNTGPQVTDDDGGLPAYGAGYAATIAVQGSNLVEGGLAGFSDVLSGDPLLAPLGDYGGPTPTMALLPGSPAIGQGIAVSGITTDQRGFALDSPRPDIGAFQSHPVVVNTTSDGSGSLPGDLDLRQAIDLAEVIGTAATIAFDPTLFAAHQTIGLTDGPLELSDTSGLLTIDGPAAGLTIDAGGKSRVFVVDSGVTAALSGLTITGGSISSGFGGGLENLGTVTLTDCTLSGNSASLGRGGGLANDGTATLVDCTINGNSAGDGGGVYNNATATLTDCTISGNSAHDDGGGVYNYGTATLTDCTISGNSANAGGGLWNYDGTAKLTNCTISGNSADAGGGVNAYGPLTLTACTISGNSADIGGGVYLLSDAHSRSTIGDTIVAGNAANTSPDLFGTIDQDQGSNLIGDGDGASGFTAAGDQVGTAASPIDPLLAPLGDYGGPTQTMALLAGSPAIDKGDNTLVPIDPSTGLPVTTDQRGFTRVVNGTVDIGAFEDQVVVTTPTNPQTAIVGSAATVNLGSFADSAINPGNSTVVVDFGDGSPTMTVPNVAPGSLGSVTHTFTSPGTNTVTVTVTDQFGDANLGTLAVVVETPTSISVSASSAAPAFGQPETFTATVTTPSGEPIPTSSDGMVTFYDGATVLGSETLSGSPATATLSTSALAPGPHTITASYSGDANFVASGPAGVLVTVTVPVSATFLTEDTTTRGNWIGAYGTEGYNDLGSAVSNPTYATITPAGQALYTWATPPLTATQALQVPPPGTSRIAAAWYSSTSFTVDVNVAAGHSYNLELYFLDYDAHGRAETVTLTDSSTGTTLNSQSVSNFASGEYLVWTISGNVLITITRTAGVNALLSGLFFDPAGTTPPSPPPAATASFLDADTTTQGNWIGTYGTQGYNDLGSGVNNPTYATVTPAGQSLYTWATPPFSAGQALLVPPAGVSRIAAAWYSSTSFTVDVNVAAGHSYNLELYFLDYDAHGRAETVTLTDSSTGTTLNSQSVSNFASGEYLVWTISGNVLITITRTAGINAVLDGLFFDPAGPPLPPPPPTATASFLATDTTTQGNWIGVYGNQGFNVLGSGVSNPAGATVTPASQTLYTWATPPFSAGGALQVPPAGTSRIAAAWYSSTSFTIDVNLAAGYAYNLELYFLDYDARGRAETVTLSTASTDTTLNSQSISNFARGEYLIWTISGNVLITITRTAGVNAVLSGLFFTADAAPVMLSTAAVSAVGASGGTGNGSSVQEQVATTQIGVLSPSAQESRSPATSLAALDAVLSSGPIATLNDASGTDHSHNGSATTFPKASNVTDLRDELVYDVALEQISGNPKRARSILGYI